MKQTLYPLQIFQIWRDRVSGSGVQKLPRATPAGFSWIYMDRENKRAALYKTRNQCRHGKAQ